jgi:hypothetical protein
MRISSKTIELDAGFLLAGATAVKDRAKEVA